MSPATCSCTNGHGKLIINYKESIHPLHVPTVHDCMFCLFTWMFIPFKWLYSSSRCVPTAKNLRVPILPTCTLYLPCYALKAYYEWNPKLLCIKLIIFFSEQTTCLPKTTLIMLEQKSDFIIIQFVSTEYTDLPFFYWPFMFLWVKEDGLIQVRCCICWITNHRIFSCFSLTSSRVEEVVTHALFSFRV